MLKLPGVSEKDTWNTQQIRLGVYRPGEDQCAER